jgi:hypothetical protein
VSFRTESSEQSVYAGVSVIVGGAFFSITADEAPTIMMNVIYNSDDYYVVEYPAEHAYELVDKRTARGTFFQGDVAEKFAQSLHSAVAEEATAEHIDEFLGGFDTLLNVRVVYH